MDFEKTAKSLDPIQQKLRDAKKDWNKKVSQFIDDLIHYKKLVNGQPNKFFKERSNIKNPIPADPNAILGSLLSDFQEIAQVGQAIISQQTQYSETRTKSQPKPSVVTNPDLAHQLALLEENLISLGSNRLSRLLTKLKNPSIGNSEKARSIRYRLAILDDCAKIYKQLNKFQVEIVKSSDNSIKEAYNIFHSQIWRNWDLLLRSFNLFKINSPENIPELLKIKESPKSEIKPAVKPETLSEKTAQKFIQKWLGKKNHELSLFDKTSGYRLDIYKMADEIRETLDQMMDSLERDLNPEEISSLIQQISFKMTSLRGMMRALHLSLPKTDNWSFF